LTGIRTRGSPWPQRAARIIWGRVVFVSRPPRQGMDCFSRCTHRLRRTRNCDRPSRRSSPMMASTHEVDCILGNILRACAWFCTNHGTRGLWHRHRLLFRGFWWVLTDCTHSLLSYLGSFSHFSGCSTSRVSSECGFRRRSGWRDLRRLSSGFIATLIPFWTRSGVAHRKSVLSDLLPVAASYTRASPCIHPEPCRRNPQPGKRS
jgi:hypothetical protein